MTPCPPRPKGLTDHSKQQMALICATSLNHIGRLRTAIDRTLERPLPLVKQRGQRGRKLLKSLKDTAERRGHDSGLTGAPKWTFGDRVPEALERVE